MGLQVLGEYLITSTRVVRLLEETGLEMTHTSGQLAGSMLCCCLAAVPIAHLGDGPAGQAISATEALDQLAAGLHIHSQVALRHSTSTHLGDSWAS